MGLPIWARWIRVARRDEGRSLGELDVPVTVGGATIRPGDLVVLDADGVTVVARRARGGGPAGVASPRGRRRRVKRAKLQAGELSYELDGLGRLVE